MIKVFDILQGSCHGQQILRTQLQSRLQEPSKGYKNGCLQISGKMKKKILREGKWLMTTESFIHSKHFKESDFVHDISDAINCRKRKLQKGKA